MLGLRPVGSAALGSFPVGNFIQVVDDYLVFSDKINRSISLGIIDQRQWSDTAIAFRLGSLLVADSFQISDRTARNVNPIIEGVFFIENLSAFVVNKTPSVADKLNLFEIIKAQRVVVKTTAELLSFTDSVRRERSELPYDIFQLIEKLNLVISKRVLTTDTIIYLENLKLSRNPKPLADRLVINDSVAYKYPIKLTRPETNLFFDFVLAKTLSPQNVFDFLTIYDQISSTFNKITSVDTLSLSDQIKVKLISLINLCDTLNFKDTVVKNRVVSLVDTLAFLEKISTTNLYDRLVFIDFIVTNAIYDLCENKTYVPQKTKSDGLILGDSVTVKLVKKISISDIFQPFDGVVWR